MKYVVRLQFGEADGGYVRLDNSNNTWAEVLDPTTATEFSTKKEAVEWMNKNTTFGEYAVPLSKEKQVQEFEEWVAGGMVRRVIARVDASVSRPYNSEDKYEVLEWWWKVTTSDEDLVRYEDYETWPNLYEVFEHLWSFVSYHDVDDYSKLTHTVDIRVKPDSNFELFEQELNLVLDRLTYVDENGDLIIKIFDRFLSEHGNSVCLVRQQDGKWRVDSRYSRKIEPTTLKKCFEYLCRERYYED